MSLIRWSGLFSRILFWLLGTILLVVSLLVGFTMHVGSKIRQEKRLLMQEVMASQGKALADLVEQADEDGFPRGRMPRSRFWLVSSSGEILIRPHGTFFPEKAVAARYSQRRLEKYSRAHMAVASLVPQLTRSVASFSTYPAPVGSFLSFRATSSTGAPYVLLAWEPGGATFGLMRHLEFDADLLIWLSLLVALLSLSSFRLARNLAQPILDCQAISRKISEGNLQARLPPSAMIRKDELGDLATDINGMAQRIEEMFGAQKRLLQDISHELRTPLTRMQVARELLLDAAEPERVNLLNKVGDNIERLNSLIQQILDFSRLDRLSGNTWEKAQFDLVTFAQGLLSDLTFEVQRNNRSLKAHLPAIPFMFHGSQEFLRRAVENILRNAVRHTPIGTSVELFLERQASEGSSMAVFRIRDQGPGVHPEFLAHLFDPFTRGPGNGPETTPGLGLGLAIAKRAVEAHQGTIFARNVLPNGFDVTIQLPVTG